MRASFFQVLWQRMSFSGQTEPSLATTTAEAVEKAEAAEAVEAVGHLVKGVPPVAQK